MSAYVAMFGGHLGASRSVDLINRFPYAQFFKNYLDSCVLGEFGSPTLGDDRCASECFWVLSLRNCHDRVDVRRSIYVLPEKLQ